MKLVFALVLAASIGCSSRTKPEQQPTEQLPDQRVQEYYSKIDPLSIDFELHARTEARAEGVTGVIISTSPPPLPGSYHFKFCEITGGYCTPEYSFLESRFESILDLDGEGFSASVRFCLDHPSLSMRPGVVCSHDRVTSFSMPNNNRTSETFRLMSERLRIDQELRYGGAAMQSHLMDLAKTVEEHGGSELPEDAQQLLRWVRDETAGKSAVGSLISKEDLQEELKKIIQETRPPEIVIQQVPAVETDPQKGSEQRLLALEKQLTEKDSELAELQKAAANRSTTDKKSREEIVELQEQIAVLRSAIMLQSELNGMEWAAMVVVIPVLLFTFHMFNGKRSRTADIVKWEYYHIFNNTMYRYKNEPIGLPAAEAWLSETWRLLTSDPKSYADYAVAVAKKKEIDVSKVDMEKFVHQIGDLRTSMLVAVGVAGAVSALYYFYNRAQINEQLAKTKRITEILKPTRVLESVNLGLTVPTTNRHPFWEFIEQEVEPRQRRLREISRRLEEIAQNERPAQ